MRLSLRFLLPLGLVLAGLAYDFCVRYSAEDAHREGFEVLVVEDCCAAIDVQGSKATTQDRLRQLGIRSLALAAAVPA